MDDERDFFFVGTRSRGFAKHETFSGKKMDSVTIHAQSAIPSPVRLLRMWEREKRGGMGGIDKKAANRSERGEPEQSNSFHN